MEEKLINQEETSPLEEAAAVPQECVEEETVVVPQADTEEAPVLEETSGEAEKAPCPQKRSLPF